MKKIIAFAVMLILFMNIFSAYSIYALSSDSDTDTFTFVATEDTTLNAVTPSDGEKASANVLYTRWRALISNARYANYGLLKFDITSLKSENEIMSAKLGIYITSVGSDTKLGVYEQNDLWSESDIGKIASDVIEIEGTKPISGIIDSVSIQKTTSANEMHYYELDVTSYLASKHNKASVLSFMILPTNDSVNVGFCTSEHESYKPYLKIKTTPVPETVGGFTKSELENTYYIKYDDLRADVKVDEVFDISSLPTGGDMVKRLNGKGHPRILLKPDDVERIKNLKKTDEVMQRIISDIRVQADDLLEKEPASYLLKYGQLSSSAKEAPVVLGFMYQLEEDPLKKAEYGNRCRAELLGAANFVDWNPAKALNTGEIALGVGIGYDLIYDILSPGEREIIKNAIVTKAFKPFEDKPLTQNNNWNPVVNGGLSVAALAIGDEESSSAISSKILGQSIKVILNAFVKYYPDGTFAEGLGYWEYSMDYIAAYLCALDNALGTDYSISSIEGLDKTGYFPIYTMGASNSDAFSFGDSSPDMICSPTMYYLSRKFNNPDFGAYQLRYSKEKGTVYDAVWFDGSSAYEEATYLNKKDHFFGGCVNFATMRSSFDDENALFLGFKGGYNQSSHGDLDIGTFSFSALGERWTFDLEGPDYSKDMGNLPPYFRLSRYTYYSKSPQGHNTIVINPEKGFPDVGFGQELQAYSVIEEFESNENGGYGIIDMTSAYKQDVISAKRGFMMLDHRSSIIVRDEIEMNDLSELWWFMHTDKEIELSDDRRSAMLKSGEKCVRVDIMEPVEAAFDVMDALSLSKTPGVFIYDSRAHSGIKKLSIHLEDIQSTTIAVKISTVNANNAEKEVSLYDTAKLSDWKLAQYISGEDADIMNLAEISGDDGDYLCGDIKLHNNSDSFCAVAWYDDAKMTRVDLIDKSSFDDGLCHFEIKSHVGCSDFIKFILLDELTSLKPNGKYITYNIKNIYP